MGIWEPLSVAGLTVRLCDGALLRRIVASLGKLPDLAWQCFPIWIIVAIWVVPLEAQQFSGMVVAWQTGFGMPTGAQKSDGDYDNDGDVDGDDFLGWQAEFGSGSGSASAAVPEPTSVLLAFLGCAAAFGALNRRRRPVL